MEKAASICLDRGQARYVLLASAYLKPTWHDGGYRKPGREGFACSNGMWYTHDRALSRLRVCWSFAYFVDSMAGCKFAPRKRAVF